MRRSADAASTHEVFDDCLVVIDEIPPLIFVDGQTGSQSGIGQNKAGTLLILFPQQGDQFLAWPLEFYSPDIKFVAKVGEIGEQSFQDRAFRSVQRPVQTIHEIVGQGEEYILAHENSVFFMDHTQHSPRNTSHPVQIVSDNR